MSTKIYDDNNMSITSFSGGKSRGRCLHFLSNDYAEYDEEEVRKTKDIIDKWLNGDT